jgi:hypothetical protein
MLIPPISFASNYYYAGAVFSMAEKVHHFLCGTPWRWSLTSRRMSARF